MPSATSPGELVVNGMSPSRRDSPFANSGFVTSIELEDIPIKYGDGPFRAMRFQSAIEQSLFQYGDGSQACPAQRLIDFTRQKIVWIYRHVAMFPEYILHLCISFCRILWSIG